MGVALTFEPHPLRKMADYQVGIDLGTSKCCVAVFKDNAVHIVQDNEGHRTIPSYVSFTDGGVLLGHAAKARANIDPQNTIYSILHLLGKKRREVLHRLQNLPYEVVETEAGRLKIQVALGRVGTDTLYPEEVLAILLSHFRTMATTFLSRQVTGAVISHPHSFDSLQLQLLRTAAGVAGLTHVHLSPSSSLAALAYGHQRDLYRLPRQLKMVVFDVGASCSEASLVTYNGGNSYSVISSCCTMSGGYDIITALTNHFIAELRNRSLDATNSTRRLTTECERLVRTLSAASSACLELDAIFPGTTGMITITRDQFNSVCEDVWSSIVEVMQVVLEGEPPGSTPVDQCIVVGGASRVPHLQSTIGGYFRSPLCRSVNADEGVAYGAAVLCANLTGQLSVGGSAAMATTNQFSLEQIVPNSIGIETESGRIQCFIDKGTRCPVVANRVFPLPEPRPLQFNIYEGETMETRGDKLVGSVQVGVPTGNEVEVKLSYTNEKQLQIVVTDRRCSRQMLTMEDACFKLHSSEEIVFMKIRLTSFEEQLQRRRDCMMERNLLEEYVITVRNEVTGGSLAGERAELVLRQCDETLGLAEEVDTRGRVRELQRELEGMYQHTLEAHCRAGLEVRGHG